MLDFLSLLASLYHYAYFYVLLNLWQCIEFFWQMLVKKTMQTPNDRHFDNGKHIAMPVWSTLPWSFYILFALSALFGKQLSEKLHLSTQKLNCF